MNKSGISLFLSVLSLVISIFLVVNLLHNRSPRVAYVDASRLLENYQGFKAARKEFQQKSLVWQANVDTLSQELRHTAASYEQDKPGLSAKERQLTEQLIHSKQQQLVQYRNALQEQAAQEDAKLTGQVVESINQFLAEYGKREGYQIIFAATHMGNIAYAEEGMDITDEVLLELNR